MTERIAEIGANTDLGTHKICHDHHRTSQAEGAWPYGEQGLDLKAEWLELALPHSVPTGWQPGSERCVGVYLHQRDIGLCRIHTHHISCSFLIVGGFWVAQTVRDIDMPSSWNTNQAQWLEPESVARNWS